MELLIIKSGKDYIRFKEGGYFLTGLEKASVFPMEKLIEVKQHEAALEEKGFQKVCIKKLVLTEKDL